MLRKVGITLGVAALLIAGLAAPAQAFGPGHPCERAFPPPRLGCGSR